MQKKQELKNEKSKYRTEKMRASRVGFPKHEHVKKADRIRKKANNQTFPEIQD